MKTIIRSSSFIATALLSSVAALATEVSNCNYSVTIQTLGQLGFMTPESMEYQPDEDLYLISNINGHPAAADGNGFISRISPDGSFLDLKWIDGSKEGITLNAPKGLELHNGKLYVTDLTQVQVFDAKTGDQLDSITIEGSTFLNGIAATPDGIVVTDTGFTKEFKPSGTDAVYLIRDDESYTTVAYSTDLGGPNGIWPAQTGYDVVSFVSGEYINVNTDGTITKSIKPPMGKVDGLIQLADGNMVFSSWEGSAIYARSSSGEDCLVVGDVAEPADLGFDTKRNRILVPLFSNNELVLIDID